METLKPNIKPVMKDQRPKTVGTTIKNFFRWKEDQKLS